MGEDAGWTHIALVVDDSGEADENYATGTLYVNGRKIASGKVRNEKNANMKTYLGVTAWAADGYYKGLVDELVFTSEVLTDADIEKSYMDGVENSGNTIAKITSVSPDDGKEIEVEYGTSLADVKRKLQEIAYTAKAEGSAEDIELATTSDMWTLDGYTITSEGTAEATVKLQAPEGYLFNLGGKLSVTAERKVTVKIKAPVTISAVTPSQQTLEVPYGATEDAIKDALAKLTFAVTTSDSSAYEIANAKSLWTLAADGDNYKATFDLGTPKPGYKYGDNVNVEVAVRVKQPITITALTVSPDDALTVNYNTSEADLKAKLAELVIAATVAQGSDAPKSIANTADIWTIADYAATTAKDYTAKATVEAPVGYKFADGVGEVTVTVTVKPQGEHKLSEIRVTTKPRVKYIEGDDFDRTGMVVTAYYEDGKNADVTDEATIEEATNLQLGAKDIKISYSEGEGAAAIKADCTLRINTVKVEDGAAAHYTFDDTLVNDECKDTVAENAPAATWVKNSKGTEAGTSQPVYGEGVKGKAVQVGAESATDIIKLDKNVKGTDFSINMWVKPMAVAAGFKPIICSTTMVQFNRSLVIYSNPNSADTVRVYGSGRKGTNGEEDISDVLTVGKWTMLTWVNKGTTTYLYKDGVEISNSAININELPNIFLGGHGGAFNDPVFQGMYDEVGIYDSSLSATQVEKLYKTIKPTISGISVDATELNLTLAEAGNDATVIQNKLKALNINVAMKNGEAPTFTNDADWTLTPAYSGAAGTYVATKELTIPDGYDKTANVSTTLSVTVKVTDVTLQSIAVTKVPNKGYYKVGEEFNKAGMVVTATYSDNSTKDVTGSVEITNGTAKLPDNCTQDTAEQEVTISYAEGNAAAKTTTQSIMVINGGTSHGAVLALMTGYFKFDGSLKNEISGGSAEEALLTAPEKVNPDTAAATGFSDTGVSGKALKITGPQGKGIKLDTKIASTNNYTVSMWVNAVALGETANQTYAPVFRINGKDFENLWFSNFGGAENFLIRGTTWISVDGNAEYESGNQTGVLVKDTWKMLTLSVNGEQAKFYVDGEFKCDVKVKTDGENCEMYLGTCTADWTFNGEYDEVCIFGETTLTPAQVKTLYDNSKPADASTE